MTEYEDIELEISEEVTKPETVGHVVPSYDAQTVYPAEGTVFSRVDVDGMPEPTAVLNITENGSYDVARIGTAEVAVEPDLQRKSVTPTKQTQTVEPDSGYDGLDSVTVNPIPSEYIVPTGTLEITSNAEGVDVTDKAAVNVAVPQGVFPSGSRTFVENGSYNVTELETAVVAVPQPAGKISITQNGTDIDIAQYAKADVAVPVPPAPTGTLNISANGTYDVAAYASAEVSVAPAGWVLDRPDANGMPTRATFYPSEGDTVVAANIFIYSARSNAVQSALTEVLLGVGTTEIGNDAFYGCPALASITVPEGVTRLGDRCLQSTAIRELIIPMSVTAGGAYFCRWCSSLEYIDLGGITLIGYYWFQNSILKTCKCRANITVINPADFPNTMELYDFSANTQVPNLTQLNTIGYGAGTVIRVPSALLTDWQAATNWNALPTDTSLDRYVVWEGV